MFLKNKTTTMYSKEAYLPIRNKMRKTLVNLLRKDRELYSKLLKVSDTGNSDSYLIEPAFFWGESQDNGGCFRFHQMLNFQNGLRGRVVYLHITHVPWTDVGYPWEGNEIHVHSKEPFTHQPVISSRFLQFMDELSDPKQLQELLEKIVESEQTFNKADFVKELKAERA